MTSIHRVLASSLLRSRVLVAAPGAAQSDSHRALSPLAVGRRCAASPRPRRFPRVEALRVIGAQDTEGRDALDGQRDLLVIGGGTGAGVQLGQQFFVRRARHVRRPREAPAGGRPQRSAGSASSPSTTRRPSRRSTTSCGDDRAATISSRSSRRSLPDGADRDRHDRRARLPRRRAGCCSATRNRADRGRRLHADRSRDRSGRKAGERSRSTATFIAGHAARLHRRGRGPRTGTTMRSRGSRDRATPCSAATTSIDVARTRGNRRPIVLRFLR